MTIAQSERQKRAFLDRFKVVGNITRVCREIKLNRRTVYLWQETDDTFAAEFRQAEIEATETLEAEAHRRAVEGLRRLKFDKGVAVLDPATGEPYTELEYSDTLLIFLLKARAPEKYREKYDGPGAGDQSMKVVDREAYEAL